MWFQVSLVCVIMHTHVDRLCLYMKGSPTLRTTEGLGCFLDQTSVWLHCDNAMVQLEAEGLQQDSTAPSCRVQKTLRHIFLSKTVSLHRCVFEHSFPLTERASSFQVIRPETCVPCGKRIRFGKVAVKCRSCRVVAHPECKQKLPIGCSAGIPVTGSAAQTAPVCFCSGFWAMIGAVGVG